LRVDFGFDRRDEDRGLAASAVAETSRITLPLAFRFPQGRDGLGGDETLPVVSSTPRRALEAVKGRPSGSRPVQFRATTAST
jgi:hypothetical protein